MIESIGAIVVALVASFFFGRRGAKREEKLKDLERENTDRKKIDAVVIDDDIGVLRDSMRERGKQGGNL